MITIELKPDEAITLMEGIRCYLFELYEKVDSSSPGELLGCMNKEINSVENVLAKLEKGLNYERDE
jgi:hypothetical protein